MRASIAVRVKMCVGTYTYYYKIRMVDTRRRRVAATLLTRIITPRHRKMFLEQ